MALPGWFCGTRNGLVLTAWVPPSSLTLVPARVGDDGQAGGWEMSRASLGGFITGHQPVCGREVIKWAACSLCPRARSSLLPRQLLALPHGSRDTHPEGQHSARTHALPAATSVPDCRPPTHCKATTGAAMLLASAPIWPWACTGQDNRLSTQGSVPVRYALVPSSYCPTTTPS